MKVIGLIPTRLNSLRLPQKATLKIDNLPLIIHTYRRAKLAKNLDDVVICCDQLDLGFRFANAGRFFQVGIRRADE